MKPLVSPEPSCPAHATLCRPRARATRAEGTAARLRALGSALALALAAGCAGPLPAPDAPSPDAGEALAPGALRVSLVFGEEADLDLYVSDPLLEAVYFANSPSRSGGAIDADRRCDDPPPRVERVTFPAARAGRYRVGIDFPRRCRISIHTVQYLVIVEIGSLRQEQRGEIGFARFQPRVLELTIPEPAGVSAGE